MGYRNAHLAGVVRLRGGGLERPGQQRMASRRLPLPNGRPYSGHSSVLRCDCKPPPPVIGILVRNARAASRGGFNKRLARLIRYEVHCTLPPHGEPFLRDPEQERTDMFEAALAERGDKTPA
jgi:hypothetical protein